MFTHMCLQERRRLLLRQPGASCPDQMRKQVLGGSSAPQSPSTDQWTPEACLCSQAWSLQLQKAMSVPLPADWVF